MSKLRVALVGLYSTRYPSIGETHGLSTIAGHALSVGIIDQERLLIVDMVAESRQSVDEIVPMLTVFRPDVLGISLPYGTFEALGELKDRLDEIRPKLVILGGVLATYIPQLCLANFCCPAIAVVGEGEDAFVSLLQMHEAGLPLTAVPNTAYIANNRLVSAPRELIRLSHLGGPYRGHARKLLANHAQIFVENSRGCSWAACTFCLRGLTDVEGRAREFRRFPKERTLADINNLYEMGVRNLTFADEDFLGGIAVDGGNGEELLSIFDEFSDLKFDASLTIHSVYNSNWSLDQIDRRRQLLSRLRNCGLRKVFLGVESGSRGQLKRFAKGHTADEALHACNIVRDVGCELEIGFIMFDPLCSLHELQENVRFLQMDGLAECASFLANEMRLQVDSRYLLLLQREERLSNRHLHDVNFDPNTLTHSCVYKDRDVAEVVLVAREMNQQFRVIHYPLKNLVRYAGGILSGSENKFLAIVREMRATYLGLLGELFSDSSSARRVQDELSARILEWAVLVEQALGGRKYAVESSVVADLLRAIDQITFPNTQSTDN